MDIDQSCRQQLELSSALDNLADLAEASTLAERMRRFLTDAVSDGRDGVRATHLISTFNDRLTEKIITLTARQHRLPKLAWCWLAFGSEGRQEQTFVTDQDNGLIFNAASAQEANALRPLFLPFAEAVNQHLAVCGFPLCKGQIMASNPAWCLSFDEWRGLFIDWVRRPDPTALLNASIFFDLRPLYGDADLAERLRSVLLSMTVATPSMLHLMAANALQAEVPLNFRGELAVDQKHGLDAKKFGSRIFVDAARIFALATATRTVNTRQRLQQAGLSVGMQAAEIAAVDAAFGQILRLRLSRQVAASPSPDADGHALDTAALNEMDRVILRESLKQARRLQQRLKLNYVL